MGRLNARQKRERNEWIPCSVHLCSKARKGLGLYCSRHASTAIYYGHPLQTALTRTELDPYKRSLIRLIKCNRDHPALKDCLALIEKWLEDHGQRTKARNGAPAQLWQHKLDKEVWRLTQQNVSSAAIFIEVAAVHFFSMQNQDRLALVTRQYKFALGRAFLLTKGRRVRYGCHGSRINGRAVFSIGSLCSTAFRRVFEAMAEPFKAYHANTSPRSEPLRPSDIERAIGKPPRRNRRTSKEQSK